MARPIEYRPEFCEIALNVLDGGESLAAVCAELDITKPTLSAWRETYPEFGDAVSLGLMKAQRDWESLGRSGVTGDIDKFGSSAWIFTMKNRFRDDYADDKKQEDKSSAESALEQILSGKVTITTHD